MSSSIFSASDKAIYDALNQSKVTNSSVKDLFLQRGVLISKLTKRKVNANNFSRLIHGYNDYSLLSNILGSISRREKITSLNIEGDLSLDDVEVAANDLSNYIENFDAKSEVFIKDEQISIQISYRTTNFNKSEFRQVSDKVANILIEKNDTGIYIRSPMNDVVNEIKNKLIELIKLEVDDIVVEEISLCHIEDSKLRTLFFTELVRNMTGYEETDVTDVFVYHPKINQNSNDDDDDDDDDDVDSGVHISKASLKGEGVLKSIELNALYNEGFYIWKIVWQSKEINTIDSDIYEFEAQFSDPEDFSQFSYLARGFYKYQSIGAYNKGRVQFTNKEEQDLNKIIEIAARDTIKNITLIEDD